MSTLRWPTFNYPSLQFGIWRAIFGFYLMVCYLWAVPYGPELYSRSGPFADLQFYASKRTFFPRYLLQFDSPELVSLGLQICVVLSALIMVGYLRRSAAMLLWFVQMWEQNRLYFLHGAEHAFINWLIFALVFIPTGERFAFGKKKSDWHMPEAFYWGAWMVLAVGYSYAGIAKLNSPDGSWLNGTALYYILSRNLVRLSWYGSFFESVPLWFFKPATWAAVILEAFCLVFVLFKTSRVVWWLAATATHFVLLFFLQIIDVHFGMIIFHLFLLPGLVNLDGQFSWPRSMFRDQIKREI